MDFVAWSEAELNRLNDDGDEMQARMNRHLLSMVKVFDDEGHSGFSASYAVSMLERLLRMKPVTPLTGEDDEWNDVGDGVEQNKRCSSVFRKNRDNATAYNIDGKVFSDNGGRSWYTCRESHVPVAFPYTVPLCPERVILRGEEADQCSTSSS